MCISVTSIYNGYYILVCIFTAEKKTPTKTYYFGIRELNVKKMKI